MAKKLLVVGNRTSAFGALIERLSRKHQVTVLAREASDRLPSSVRQICGHERTRDLVREALTGQDAVIDACRLENYGVVPEHEAPFSDGLTSTYLLLTEARQFIKRYVLLSSLRLFEAYEPTLPVTEQWAPRPTTNVADISLYLREIMAREVARVAPYPIVNLRLGRVEVEPDVGDPRAVHIDDVATAVERGLDVAAPPTMHGLPPYEVAETGWWTFHISGGGLYPRFPIALAAEAPFDYRPRHDLTGGWTPARKGRGTHRATIGVDNDIEPRPIDKVAIFGAGGPVGVAVARELIDYHRVCQCDIQPIAEMVHQPYRANMAKWNPPVRVVLPPPHSQAIADVSLENDVERACVGADAIVNLAVSRHDPRQAFKVNTLGAFNIAKVAVARGIRRVVQTGPLEVSMPHPAGYWYDDDLPSGVPGRPGSQLYVLSKMLGHEILKIFSRHEGLEVPVLLFARVSDPDGRSEGPHGPFPFSVSWRDAGRAVKGALHTEDLMSPFEKFHITANLPHGRYRLDREFAQLGWRPLDSFEGQLVRSPRP